VLTGTIAALGWTMAEPQPTIVCTVCGEEVAPHETAVHTEEGAIAHVRCLRSAIRS